MEHITVLLHEAITGLEIHKGDVFVDATLGGGGHSALVCETFGKDVQIIGIDADQDAIARTEKRLSGKCKFQSACTNFSELGKMLDTLKVPTIDRLLFDLGLSSFQLEESGRGFSFKREEPLLMTMRKESKEDEVTAYDVVNSWGEENLANIIFGYGEERYSRRIAKAIVLARETKLIETTTELAEIIFHAVPGSYRHGKLHPATKTFQAIRIAVNDELQSIEKAISEGFTRLSSGGRIAVISFHSLEDRIIKHFFRQKVSDGLARAITKKPIIPSDEEITMNPRSRSAKLRIIEKI